MKHILIVHESSFDAMFVQSQIADLENGYVTMTCRSEEVITRLALTRFDLIVSDGIVIEQKIDFTMWMQRDEHYKFVPVIFLVSDNSDILLYSELAQRKVSHSTLKKPYLQRSLKNLVNLLLSSSMIRNIT